MQSSVAGSTKGELASRFAKASRYTAAEKVPSRDETLNLSEWAFPLLTCFLSSPYIAYPSASIRNIAYTVLTASHTNIALLQHLWRRCASNPRPLRAVRAFSTTSLLVQRVEQSSSRATSTGHHPHPQHSSASVKRPWPFIKLNMSDSEDDRPLVRQGTWHFGL